MVKGDTVFFILLIIILFVTLYYGVLPILSGMPKSKCIIEQWSILRGIETAVTQAKSYGSVYPEYRFDVMYCIECIWYDSANDRLMVKIDKQADPVPFDVSVPYLRVSDGCPDCDLRNIWGDVISECANLRKNQIHTFEVTDTYAKCISCICKDDGESCEYSWDCCSQDCSPAKVCQS